MRARPATLALLLAGLLLAAGVAGCDNNEVDVIPTGPVPLSSIVPVTVRVMNALSNDPVQGATVSFKTSPLYYAGLDPLKSDREGRVMAGVLNGHVVNLDVFADEYKPQSHTFTLEGQATPFEYIVYLAPERLPD